ncbi:MAG: DNRLRE domain-containing protein, partial [Thermoplasmata archaeon]
NPNTNYNAQGLKFGGSSTSNQYWTFIKMDLGAMPVGAIIQSAELCMYDYSALNSNSIIAAVYEVQSAWQENTLTWNTAQALTINSAIEAQNALSDAEVGNYIRWNITTLVQKWYINPTLNYGVVIKCADTPDNIISSNDSECSVPMIKPFLYISYQNLGDITAPTTTATITTGTLGSNGWYTSDVTVSLSATDSESGVKSISYGEGSIETTVNGNTVSVTLTTEGQHTLLFQAKDNAGNVESVKQIVIKIDKSAPTNIVIDEIWYDNSQNWYNTSTTAYYNNKDSARSFRIHVSYTDTVSGTSSVSGSAAFGDNPEDAWGTDGFVLEYTIEQGTSPLSDTTITVTVHDKAGHNASYTIPLTFKQDITAPSGYSIDAPEVVGVGISYTVTISGGSDTGSGLGNYYLDAFTSDSGEPTTVRNSMIGVTSAGTHYYRGYATDLVGNKGGIVSATTIVGNSIPSLADVIEVSGGEALYYNSTAKKLYYSNRISSSFTINIDVTGSGAGFDSAAGSAAFGDSPTDNTPGSSPAVFQLTYTIEQGAEFTGTITITLTKGTNTETLELAVELDNTPPSGILVTAPTVPIETYIVTISNATDTGSGLDYYLLDKFTSVTGEPTIQRTSMTGSVDVEGTFYYRGTAVDRVGNKAEVVQKVVYVDFTSPTISITSVTSGANAPMNVTSGTQWTMRYSNKAAFNFEINVHASDSGSGLQNGSGSDAFGDSPSVQCNGASQGDYTFAYSVEADASASSITITFTDRAGKSASVTLTLVLDNTAPPTITLEAKRLGNTIELTWTPPTDPSGVVKYVIYRGTSETDMTVLAEVSASQDGNSAKDGFQYVDNNPPSSKVYYKVVAVDSVGNSAPVSSAPAKKVNPVAQTTTEFPWLLVILGFVVAIVIVILLLFMFRRKPTSVQHSTVQSNYPQQPQNFQQMQQQNLQSTSIPSQQFTNPVQTHASMQPPAQPIQQITSPVSQPTPTQARPIAPVAATNSVVCNICKGIVKKGLMVIPCTCGYNFHETCALRIKTCPKCGKAIA